MIRIRVPKASNFIDQQPTLGSFFKSRRGVLMGIGAFSFFINLLMLTGPIYMLQIYDRVLSSRSISTLVSLSVLMAVLYLFVWILDSCRSKVLIRFANQLERDFSHFAFKARMRIGLRASNSSAINPINDLTAVRNFISSNATATIFDLPWIPIYLAVIFMFHWTMGVFAVIGAIIVIMIAIYIEAVSKNPQNDERKAALKSEKIAEQSYRNSETIQAMGMEDNVYNHWKSANNAVMINNTKGIDRISGARAFSRAFRMFLQSGILGIGAALAINQIISPGSMIAGSIILGRALTPAQSLIGQWKIIVAAREAYARLKSVFELLPAEEERMSLPEPAGFVEVKNLVAGPPELKTPVLSGLNFTLQPGDGLAIIGPSAAGKSTLARFLVGTWLPQRGDVRIDGATYGQWRGDGTNQIGKRIGYLPQQVELFSGTVRDIIGRFDPSPQEQKILDAANMAGIHAMILQLPNGYNTHIGSGGTVLSGGQMQRIALARALYGDPCLVILDEPNANLDQDGEQALSHAIAGLRSRGKTVILITHRKSAMEGLNKMLVLKGGRQVAFGPTQKVLDYIKTKSAETKPVKKAPTPTPIEVPTHQAPFHVPVELVQPSAQLMPQAMPQVMPQAMPMAASAPSQSPNTPQPQGPIKAEPYVPQPHSPAPQAAPAWAYQTPTPTAPEPVSLPAAATASVLPAPPLGDPSNPYAQPHAASLPHSGQQYIYKG